MAHLLHSASCLNPNSIRFAIAVIALSFSGLNLADQAGLYVPNNTTAPLNQQEFDAVIGEIKAMVKTDESRVSEFVVREATPSRIDRLYSMHELVQQPKIIRENGLIFAGQGTILSFEKPSDIINKLSTWFPEEIRAARSSRDPGFFSHLSLFGPYTNWNEQPAVFLTLWKCMPQIAWLKPIQSPFARELNQSARFTGVAARSSGELDFGYCVRERSGLRPAWTQREYLAVKKEQSDRYPTIEAALKEKFARFLSTNGCRGTGPDDCVLILLLWSSLDPSDPKLIAAIQQLEDEVAPAGPLPEFRRVYGAGTQEGEPRFDAALRKAAFLRAKLASVLKAPAAWPPDAIAATFHQMTLMGQQLTGSLDHRWSYYELDYHNEHVNPWGLLSAKQLENPRVAAAISGELKTLAEDKNCAMQKQWFAHASKAMQTGYVLGRLQRNQRVRCAAADWEWLASATTREANAMRKAYLATVVNKNAGFLHEYILSGISQNGERCFDKKSAAATSSVLREICGRWISEPQRVRARLKHGVISAQQYRRGELEPLPPSLLALRDDWTSTQTQWLRAAMQKVNVDAHEQIEAFAKMLAERGVAIISAERWIQPGDRSSLMVLGLSMQSSGIPAEDAWPLAGQRVLAVIGPHEFRLISVPDRFDVQQNEGSVSSVTDIDGDGEPEVWFTETSSECSEEDAKQEVGCASETVHMGEVFGDGLSYFSDDRKRR